MANKKNENNKNIIYIYLAIFIVLIIMLFNFNSNNSNMQKKGYKNINYNRKKVLKSEKYRETLSKNIKDVENNSDSVKEKEVKEVHESNKKDEKGEGKKKKIYLTFDDGPSDNTEKILSILKKNDAKATFFVNFHKGENNKEIYKRIVYEGHTIAIHSYTHDYRKIYSSEKSFKEDVLKMRDYIENVTGVRTNIYRFPGGSGNKVSKISIKKCIKILKKESMIYYDWNVENGDATGKKISSKQMINNVVNNVKSKNTPIVLMHDSADKDKTVKTLPKIIKILKKRNYEFVAINEDTPQIRQVK